MSIINGIQIENGKLIIFQKNFIDGNIENVDNVKNVITVKDGGFVLESSEIVSSKRSKTPEEKSKTGVKNETVNETVKNYNSNTQEKVEFSID